MEIVIELGDEISKGVEELVREAVEATAAHDINFQGYELIVRRGDYTCIADDAGNNNAMHLLGLVQSLRSAGCFGKNADGQTLIPIASGGYVEIMTRRGRKPVPVEDRKTARVELRVHPDTKAAWQAQADAAGLSLNAWAEARLNDSVKGGTA